MTLRAPLSILVVDHEPRLQETLRRTLEEDFTVFTAASAEEGIAVMEREFVHIVLSDQRMPGINEAGIWQYLMKPWHVDQLLFDPAQCDRPVAPATGESVPVAGTA